MSCAPPASCGRSATPGRPQPRRRCVPIGARSHERSTDRDRRRRARTPSHRRGDLRPQPLAAAAGRRTGAEVRRDHPAPRARPRRRRGDRAARTLPGGADGVVAAAPAAPAAARARALSARPAARFPRPHGRHAARPAFRARPQRDGAPRPTRVQDGRAACGPWRRPGARGVGANEARHRRALRGRCRSR